MKETSEGYNHGKIKGYGIIFTQKNKKEKISFITLLFWLLFDDP